MRTGILAFVVMTAMGVAWDALAAGPPDALASGGGQTVDSWDAIIDRARSFIAGETGVPAANLAAIKVERLTWSDSSLGCPEPGKAYLPVLTEGFQVTFEDRDAVYRVNVAGETIVSCERSVAARMRKAGRETTPAVAFVMEARQDLAARTALPVNEIGIGSIRPVVWAGDTIDCSTPKAVAGAPGRRGFEILLNAGEAHGTHVYRASHELLYCGKAEPVK